MNILFLAVFGLGKGMQLLQRLPYLFSELAGVGISTKLF